MAVGTDRGRTDLAEGGSSLGTRPCQRPPTEAGVLVCGVKNELSGQGRRAGKTFIERDGERTDRAPGSGELGGGGWGRTGEPGVLSCLGGL